MKPETAAIYEKAFNALPSGPPAIEFMRGLARFAAGLAEVMSPALTASNMEEFLAQMPEPEPEDLPMIVSGIAFMPGIMRRLTSQVAVNIRAALPPDKRGRPLALSLEDKRAIIAKVGKLHIQGVKLHDAMLRASQEFAVSVATVRRAWAERKAIQATLETASITPELFLQQLVSDSVEVWNAGQQHSNAQPLRTEAAYRGRNW